MWPYFVMVAVPAAIAIFDCVLNRQNTHKSTITAFFLIFLILLLFRSYEVGIDCAAYEFLYKIAMKHSWPYAFAHAFSMEYEAGYYFLSKIIAVFTHNFRAIIVVAAITSLVPIWYMYRENIRNHLFLAIVIFLNVGLFAIYFSALRQVMAMSFMVPAYYFTKKRKPLLFALMAVFALLMHKSAFIILLFYPVYYIRMKWYYMFVAASITTVFVFIFRNWLFNLFGSWFSSLYDAEIKQTSAISIFLLLIAMVVFSFVVPDNNAMDDDSLGLRNILVLAGILQIFAGVNPVAMRMNYYFLLFVPIAVTRVFDYTHPKNIMVSEVALLTMLGFFTAYYFYNATFGADTLSVYPYIPFWRSA